MKKVLAVGIALAMLSTLFFGVMSNAESQAVDPSYLKLTERFSDDFSDDELDTSNWKVDTPPSITEDGQLQLGGSNWIQNGYLAFILDELDSDYVLDFVMSGPKNDCYWGFAVRSPESGANPMNGGRFGVPSAGELSTGITFDVMIKAKDGKIGVTFCDGGANGEAPTALLDAPEGFDPTAANNYRIVDTGDRITLYINEAEYITIVLDADFDDAAKAAIYAADGSELMAETDVSVLGYGFVGFYQRNNTVHVDNVVLSDLKVEDPNATEAPTAVPTEVPTEAPTDAPAVTDAPAATDASAATDAPAATEKAAESESSSSKTPLIIGIIAAVVVVAAVVIGIAVSKKKKK